MKIEFFYPILVRVGNMVIIVVFSHFYSIFLIQVYPIFLFITILKRIKQNYYYMDPKFTMMMMKWEITEIPSFINIYIYIRQRFVTSCDFFRAAIRIISALYVMCNDFLNIYTRCREFNYKNRVGGKSTTPAFDIYQIMW